MEFTVNHLLCFGFGFSARALAARLDRREWKIFATSRDAEGIAEINAQGFHGLPFASSLQIAADVTHLLISAPPGEHGDPVLQWFQAQLQELSKSLKWLGYLSTMGVYGDRRGEWVDEDSPLEPTTARGQRRLEAERSWLMLHKDYGLPVHLFRLAGIYGPGRNQLLTVRDGSARRIIKPGQIFSRIHVEDIAGVLAASIAKPNPGRVYNVCDDEPCPPQEVVAYAADLLGLPVPPEIPFEEAELSPMAKSFYAESKRVSNGRMKTELRYNLLFPNYREGLRALLQTLPVY
ncbi:MAG: SDR family oxidoreductase [Rhizobiales bacterium]|jgi:nucleoside-diphosphate-sugar epimerase|nr:SDR family oxidoreductase [Hyphomicrobiales bacterium]